MRPAVKAWLRSHWVVFWPDGHGLGPLFELGTAVPYDGAPACPGVYPLECLKFD